MGAPTMGSRGGQKPISSSSRGPCSLSDKHLGEPLLSMNLDELLGDVLMAGSGDGSNYDQPPIDRDGAYAEAAPLLTPSHAQEMTLEDFLSKAAEPTEKERSDALHGGSAAATLAVGLVAGAPQGGDPRGAHWLRHYHHHEQQKRSVMYAPPQLSLGESSSVHIVNDPIMFLDAQISISLTSDTQTTPGGKRAAPAGVQVAAERKVERKQKRMIKNRESAARSRARKQAYTNELEIKVSRLEEENQRLKKQQEMDNSLCAGPQPEPKLRLRRTSSSSF